MAKVAHDPVHTLLYGESGSGKSTNAATYPKPMLVLMWDPLGKEAPYLRQGRPQPAARDEENGMLVREVWGRKRDKTIIRIEHFANRDMKEPDAYEQFQGRLKTLSDEVESGQWATVVLDSVTFCELAARHLHQFRLNKNSKEPRQWWAGATDLLEGLLMVSLGALNCNVVVIAHVDEDKDEVAGTFVRNPMAPGRLRKRLAAAYGELHRQFVTRTEEGDRVYAVQTMSDDRYNASSQIGAPDPCAPNYRALWADTNGVEEE